MRFEWLPDWPPYKSYVQIEAWLELYRLSFAVQRGDFGEIWTRDTEGFELVSEPEVQRMSYHSSTRLGLISTTYFEILLTLKVES